MDGYLETLKKRAKESRVYRKYQLVGIELSEILGDPAHKALYIKIAKERQARTDELIRLAKRIREQKNVRNKGGYFMRIITEKPNGAKNSRRRR